ncbi:MAG: CDP-alcohol phosphatidyltransferase family protein [Cyclobacteriaceae bacterium]
MAPLLPFIPWIIPANIITIISNLFVYLGFFVALYFNGPISRLIIAGSLLLYLVGDHLDGMQAKRTKTGSALGEFCDHYLDAFNNGIILFTAFLVFQIHNPVIVTIVLAASYLAHMSVFYEQFKTGWLTFEKLGSLEAVLLTALVIGLSSFSDVFALLTMPVVFEYRIIEVVFLSSAIGAVMTFVTTIRRTPE